MNEHDLSDHDLPKEETLHVIRALSEDKSLNQRLLSQQLNISLGKTNYLLKELTKKGFIKIIAFSRNPSKVRKLKYILTSRGMEEKMRLTGYFLQVKRIEYERLKREYEHYAKS